MAKLVKLTGIEGIFAAEDQKANPHRVALFYHLRAVMLSTITPRT
jgi:hypothetical protein